MPHRQRIAHVQLDEKTMVRRAAEVEHERNIAIYDLLEENYFAPHGEYVGPYHLHLRLDDNRLVFDVRTPANDPLLEVGLSLKPFQSIVKDYFMICESYFSAIKKSTPSQIEAIDMGRRGLHNEGSEFLKERLAGKVDVDFDTARRLFTLVCVLHIRG
ncbi:MAG: UPF0262 family protein [Rhodospirillaceae bacterium]|nr:UPF0262 family protein [Rhodospirillales bacterium]